MVSFRDMAIKRKLILITVISSSVALLLACIGFATYDTLNFRTVTRAKVATVAAMIGVNSSVALIFDDPETAGAILAALREEPQVLSGCLYDAREELFASYLRDASVSRCSLDHDSLKRPDTWVRLVHLDQPIVLDGERIGASRGPAGTRHGLAGCRPCGTV